MPGTQSGADCSSCRALTPRPAAAPAGRAVTVGQCVASAADGKHCFEARHGRASGAPLVRFWLTVLAGWLVNCQQPRSGIQAGRSSDRVACTKWTAQQVIQCQSVRRVDGRRQAPWRPKHETFSEKVRSLQSCVMITMSHSSNMGADVHGHCCSMAASWMLPAQQKSRRVLAMPCRWSGFRSCLGPRPCRLSARGRCS